MCDHDKSRKWAVGNIDHAKTFTHAAWMNIRDLPELADDKNKLFDIVTLLSRIQNKLLREWHQSFHNDYEHIMGEYRLTRYLGSDYWALTICPFGDAQQKDIARTLTAGIGYEEARLWADSEITKYEAKENRELNI